MEINSPFDPPWWFSNKHVQSCLGYVVVDNPVAVVWDQHELPDGDFIELTWAGSEEGPLVILLTGLEGSIDSHYIQHMHRALLEQNFGVLTMHYRGCGRELNRFARGYHAGDIADFSHMLSTLVRERYPNRPLFAVGFSIGGNVLLNYLARTQDSALMAGVAVSIPFEISKVADYCSIIYQWRFLLTLKNKIKKKIEKGLDFSVSLVELENMYDMRDFDRLVTAPIFGFKDDEDYYQKTSCRYVLGDIVHPVLMLHAMDDPFISPEAIPDSKELGQNTKLELSEKGGHVGFVMGGTPWKPEIWFCHRICEYIKEFL